ncbi:MAG: hypothetical protein JW728_07670 [Candidatus Aureabacteria bacterium]|nr:hypothetical protein [Candidatus Auribacterota bacterium]
MQIKEIIVYKTQIPFKSPFIHNLASRNRSDGIIVRLRGSGVPDGYGEGLPRQYVTGETVESAAAYIKNSLLGEYLRKGYKTAKDVYDDFRDSPLRRDPRENVFPGAASCAVECALLDFHCRRENKSVSEVAGKSSGAKVFYSAVLSKGGYPQILKKLLKIRLYGFKDIKIKVSGEDDIGIIRMARKILGFAAAIRVDANSAWNAEDAARIINKMEPYGVEAVEEPLASKNIPDIIGLQEKISIPVILDESLCSYEDAEKLIKNGFRGIFNLRLSKCGGFSRCEKILSAAENNGIRCILGCQVGETAILSAYGRHFASCNRNLLRIEGSYSRYLLTDDLSTEDISFRRKGMAGPLTGPGLGIKITEKKLENYCVELYRVKV